MEATNIAREIAALPPEAQKQILDFMTFLKIRYSRIKSTEKARRTKLAKEPFIGIWRTRQDMQDSTAWVRKLRNNEWEYNG
jgi:hypothetical protein